MSGKTARRLRKNHILPKKALAVCAGICLSAAPIAARGEFLISVFPHFTKPFGEAHSMQYGIGGGLRATYRPIKFLNIFAEGDYLSMAMPGIDPISIIQGQAGTGYHLDITDRIAFDLNVNIGVYNAKASKNINGISAGGALTFSYRFNPSISADVSVTANHFAQKSSPLMMINTGIAPGVTFNITEIFNNKTNLAMGVDNLAPVFPVLYSWYENNSFGKVDITNNEDSAITDVTISFYQPQYMAHAKECTTIRKIEQGQTVTVDLVAFFNEQMLELTEKTDTSSYVIVNYMRLGRKLSQTFPMDVPVYGRNNMSWDDDRRAAVFVSSKDPAAMQFGKYTASIVRDNLRVDVPLNIQYALGIFEALKEFGINYVVDPTSAFEDNVGTSSIDFLQFPYQTLMYRGGDCDDLSILVCSLFEAVGVDTAFITIPGHIFMAFNAGITPEMAETVFRNTSDFIFVDNEVWVPLEITLSDEGFYRACRYGAREWNTANAQGTAALYKMSDSWKIYQPISVPGATAYFNMPDSNAIYMAFANGIDTWSRGELKTISSDQSVRYALIKQEEETQEPELVFKENPISSQTLNNIIALANSAVAIPPAEIREEELDGEGENEEQEDELLEDILPLDFALATLQTDTTPLTPAPESTSPSTEVVESAETVSFSGDAMSSSGGVMSSSGLTRGSSSDSDVQIAGSSPAMTEEPEEEEDPFAQIQALATSFLEDTAIIAKAPAAETESTSPAMTESTVVEPVETTAESENTAETENFTEADVARYSDKTTVAASSKTKTIIIITTISAAAALAAGIIIFGKKKREGDK